MKIELTRESVGFAAVIAMVGLAALVSFNDKAENLLPVVVTAVSGMVGNILLFASRPSDARQGDSASGK